MENNETKKNSLAYRLGQIVGAVFATVLLGCFAGILVSLTVRLCQYILF